VRLLLGLLRATFGSAALGLAVLTYAWLTLPDVRSLRLTLPPTTAFMVLRADEARAAGRPVRQERQLVPYRQISPTLVRAVIVTEDAAFFGHGGVDVDELRASIETSLSQWRPPRGASTITQQLAKNLYLSPSRDPVRKIRELMMARRLEAELSKTRILEIYLNVVEWGDGIWGIEAAARRYFDVSAGDLSAEQAALLAGALINPRLYDPAAPGERLRSRQQIILGRLARRGDLQ
jgi:monofunctional biosynthetic peptidoglycan transglycosylase